MQYYYTIEVEPTNYCNAKCVFCANKNLTRPHGYMDLAAFEQFIATQQNMLGMNIFHQHHIKNYPRVTFCGLGDPLIHPQITKLVGIASKAGFYTQLVTNGALVTSEIACALCSQGLDEICFSLHSLNPQIYYEITGLEIDKTIQAIRSTVPVFQSASRKIAFWRIFHPDTRLRDTAEDEYAYMQFVRQLGLDQTSVLGPSEPWYRDGAVPNSRCSAPSDDPFWCNKILFTYNIDWQGNILLCCNDFNNEKFVLGNAFCTDFDQSNVIEKKLSVLRREVTPSICKTCKRWADNEILCVLEDSPVDPTTFLKQIIDNIEKGE